MDTMWFGDLAVQEDMMAEANFQKPQKKTGETKVRKPWKSGRYTVYLWEFLCGLLQDPECCSLIAWTNRTKKEFKIANVSEIAKLWGTIKNRPTMDDKKLLRALRYYYKTKVLKKVKGQKGVYQFLAIPYETEECEPKEQELQKSRIPTPFQVEGNYDEYRERAESSSDSSFSSEDTVRNENDLDVDLFEDIEPIIDDTELVFDEVLPNIHHQPTP